MPKRYATELQNTSKNPSKSLLGEVICHQVGMLCRPGAISLDLGLVGGRAAPRRSRNSIFDPLGIPDSGELPCSVAKESRYSACGTCSVSDVVLVRDGDDFVAGKIELHCDVDGIVLSLITTMRLVRTERAAGYAVWQAHDYAEWFETKDTLSVVVYSVLPNRDFGTLLPVELR